MRRCSVVSRSTRTRCHGSRLTGALDDALAEVEALATHPRIRVVGETGLDYYRTGPDGIPLQQNAFGGTSTSPSGPDEPSRSTTATPTTTS